MTCIPGLLFRVQGTVHSILVDFVNGDSLPRSTRILYPLVDGFGDRMRLQLTRLRQLLADGWEGQNCEFRETWKQLSELDLAVPIKPLSIAVFLSTAYRELCHLAECQQSTLICREVAVGDSVPALNAGVYQSIGLQGLLDSAQSALGDYLVGFYLHGSMATLDFVSGYSDVDTLAVIKRQVLFDPAGLMECRERLLKTTKFLYLVDPYQHHGHGVLTEVDMLLYAQPYFPIVLYAFSRPLLDSGERLTIWERDASIERQQAFLESVDFFVRAYQGSKMPKGQYAWKLFLSTLVLLPSLFLQLKEQYTCKRDSFAEVCQEFPQSVWHIIERATAVRRQWQHTSPLFVRRLLTRCSPSPWVLPMLYRKFCDQMPSWATQLVGDSILRDAYTLAVSMRERATNQCYL